MRKTRCVNWGLGIRCILDTNALRQASNLELLSRPRGVDVGIPMMMRKEFVELFFELSLEGVRDSRVIRERPGVKQERVRTVISLNEDK